MLVYGDNVWTLENIENEIEKFKEVYDKRPIPDNRGGMSSTHLFWSWYAMKTLNPEYIIESGIWKGQGTWLFEEACPKAQIFSIDIDLGNRKYISERVKYFSVDFSCIDWSFIKDKQNTVIFFDDHQNAYSRLMQMKFMGFKQALFEDNYPETKGDCYSLKKVLLGVGFDEKDKIIIPPNYAHSMYFKENVETYFEFPPIYKTDYVRWGDVWDDLHYPTRNPVLDKVDTEMQKILYAEAKDYTWICFCKLR